MSAAQTDAHKVTITRTQRITLLLLLLFLLCTAFSSARPHVSHCVHIETTSELQSYDFIYSKWSSLNDHLFLDSTGCFFFVFLF